ncbi:unnamed protein product [Rotaria sp. Silwood2]|nr:unnamed protein product [Rotaria sp. Silwood2]CAF2787919.1 unnamed protein product [Rotaria sp. Silwood2]CAF3055610.1 unnamed protein product [Rotaria sp. Silwood2]CAF3216094.1 unnamed protein product [Rotaria sp. Silwood2]CAF4129998.1 unnamed protein product [Rotaria sp. Silwood2]
MPILCISSLRRLEIHIDEIVESRQVSTLITIPSEIEQFIFDSGSTISWNDFSGEMSNFSRIRFLSIGLLDHNQKPIPARILQNVRTLSLGLLEVPFNWIIQLVATASCLVKLKLTGLVDADGFVINQRWIRLFELASTLLRVFVNVSLEQSDESYHCEKIQASLCALNLSLICNGDDNDCNLYYGTTENKHFHLQTPTKAITKNNTLTQVRIPQFNREDDKTQSFQVSLIASTTTQEVTTTSRTKRRLQSIQNYVNVETGNIEKKRIQARERMAAKRAEATPEETERQRILARKRSAARRAALTPEEAEEQRALNREKNTDRRAAFTSEEIDQQRTLNRDKMAAWRATLTTKEVEQQRALAGDRTMAKRATLSPIEAEEQRVLARKRSATRRAAYISEEAKKQQALTHKRIRLQKNDKHKQVVTKGTVCKSVDVEWPKPIDIECKTNCLKNFI